MTFRKSLMALGFGLTFIGVTALPALADSDAPVHVKKHHRAHAARAEAASCWVNGDKGAIDHGVYGYYVPCGTPGAVPAEASAWGAERR